jgi:putative toxin-antitoxin system antitoxin component (TIGR02293 family)
METSELLGTSIPEHDPVRLIGRLRAGLPVKSVAEFKKETGLSDETVAGLLAIGGRTLTRLKQSRARTLSPELSDRLYAIASLYARAIDVLGDRESALEWIGEPQFALGGATPQALLSSERGRQEVRTLLLRLEHGLLA